MGFLHRAVGFVIVGGFFLLFLWGGLTYLRKREAGRWFWHLLALVQVAVVVEAILGVVLLLTGRRNSLLHYAYGALFPLLVLTTAHVMARGMQDPPDVAAVFAAAGFILFGLTLRALATGLGLP